MASSRLLPQVPSSGAQCAIDRLLGNLLVICCVIIVQVGVTKVSTWRDYVFKVFCKPFVKFLWYWKLISKLITSRNCVLEVVDSMLLIVNCWAAGTNIAHSKRVQLGQRDGTNLPSGMIAPRLSYWANAPTPLPISTACKCMLIRGRRIVLWSGPRPRTPFFLLCVFSNIICQYNIAWGSLWLHVL